MLKILVVDDNRSSADAMARILTRLGHEVTPLFDGQSAIDAMQKIAFDLVFTDLKMEPVDGMQVLRAARERTPPLEVIVFTAFGAVEHAVEAMQLGARDFLTKPISVDQILSRVRDLTGEAPAPEVSDASEVAPSVRQTLSAVATVPSPVWLEGELGSGRYQAALMLHGFSDSEHLTLFDPAGTPPADGTWLFRNVDDLDADGQAAALKQLQTSTARRVATARSDVRERMGAGMFRSDLYFELAVLTVQVPPLRARTAEIPSLFEAAVQRFCTQFDRPVPVLTDVHRSALMAHDWPANLRELHNLAERTAVLGTDAFELSTGSATPTATLGPGFKLSTYLEQIERKVLTDALEQADGDRTEAGRLLGVERNTLRYKLNKYNLL